LLIRIVSHFYRGNKHGIDELIRIDGLPYDMLFIRRNGKTYLRPPWERDADVNIPKHIRGACTPMEISEDLPKEKNEVTGQWQAPTDTYTVLGVKLNLDIQPGYEMWQRIQRILEHSVPRDMKIPVPKPVAPDQKVPFSLEESDIPVVVIASQEAVKAAIPEPVASVETPNAPNVFKCGVCKREFDKQRGLWMHERNKRHKNTEPVAA